MTKPRRRPWTLSPRDLPDPRLLKDESARLGDLENNPAFRMLVYRQSKVPFAFAHPYLIGMGFIMLLIISVTFMGPLGVFLTPLGLSVAQIIIKAFHGKGQVFLLGITREHLLDLTAGGQSPREISLALWGYHLRTPHGLTLQILIPRMTLALVLGLGCFAGVGTLYFYAPCGFWAGLTILRHRYFAHFALKRARETLDRCMDVGRTGGISLFSGCGPALLMVLVMIISSMVTGFSYLLVAEWKSGGIISVGLLPLLLILGSTLVGGLIGFIEGIRSAMAETIERNLWYMDKRIKWLTALAHDADPESEEWA